MSPIKTFLLIFLIHLSFADLANDVDNFGSHEVNVLNISFAGNKTEIKSTELSTTKIYLGIDGKLSDFSYVRLNLQSVLKQKEIYYYCEEIPEAKSNEPYQYLECELRVVPEEEFSGRLKVESVTDWNDTFHIMETVGTLDVIGPQKGEKLIEKRIKNDFTFDLNGITDGEISNIYLCLEKDCPESDRIYCEKTEGSLTDFKVTPASQTLLKNDVFYYGYIFKNSESYFIENLYVIADLEQALTVNVKEVKFNDPKTCFYNKEMLLADNIYVRVDQEITTEVPIYLQAVNVNEGKTTYIGFQCTPNEIIPTELTCKYSQEKSLFNDNAVLEYSLDSFIARDKYVFDGIDFKFTYHATYELVDEVDEYVLNKFTINGKGLRPTKVYISDQAEIYEKVNTCACTSTHCEITKTVRDSMDKTKKYNIFYKACSDVFVRLQGKQIQLVQNEVNVIKAVYDDTENACLIDSFKIPTTLKLSFESATSSGLGAATATLSSKKGIVAVYDCPAASSSESTKTCTLNKEKSETKFTESSYDLTIESNELSRDIYTITVPTYRTLTVQDPLSFSVSEVYLKSNNVLKLDNYTGFLPKNIWITGEKETGEYKFTCKSTVTDGIQNGECTCSDKIPEGTYSLAYELCGNMLKVNDFTVYQPTQVTISKYHFGKLDGTCFTALEDGKPPHDFILEFENSTKLPAASLKIGNVGQPTYFYYDCPEVASDKLQTCTLNKVEGFIKDTITYFLLAIDSKDEKMSYSFNSSLAINYQIPLVSSTPNQTIYLPRNKFLEFQFTVSSGTYPNKTFMGDESCSCHKDESRCVSDDYLYRVSGDYSISYSLCGKKTPIKDLHVVLRADEFLIDHYEMILGDKVDFLCFVESKRQDELKVSFPIEAPMTFPELTAKWTTEKPSNAEEIQFKCDPVTQKNTIKCDIATKEKLQLGDYYFTEVSGEGFPKENFTITSKKAFTVGLDLYINSEKSIVQKMTNKKVNISSIVGGFTDKLYLSQEGEEISEEPPILTCTEEDKICTISDKFNLTDGNYDVYYDVCKKKRKIDNFTVLVGEHHSSGFELKIKIFTFALFVLLLL